MSGRGRGRDAGRTPYRGGRYGGRGRGGRGGYSNSRRTQDPVKKKLSDYQYKIGSSKNASDYIEITKHLIAHIKKEHQYGQDIGTALEKKEEMDFSAMGPKLVVHAAQENVAEAEIARRNKQAEMEFQSEHDAFVTRKKKYQENRGKAYAFLWSHCSKAMQQKIQSRSNYETIENNPIELLRAIHEHSISYQENQHAMRIILDAMRGLVNIKQYEDESLIDYTARFKSARDVFKAQIGGTISLTKFMESMDGYNATSVAAVAQCQSKACNKFLAYIYLDNADESKHGSLMSTLATQWSLGTKQCPKDLVEASMVLSDRRFDSTYHENKKKRSQQRTSNNNNNNNPADSRVPVHEVTFAQMEGRCYCCGKPGHYSPDCRHKNKPKSEWAINQKANAMLAQHGSTTGSSGDADDLSVAASTAASTAASASTTPPTLDWMATQVGGMCLLLVLLLCVSFTVFVHD